MPAAHVITGQSSWAQLVQSRLIHLLWCWCRVQVLRDDNAKRGEGRQQQQRPLTAHAAEFHLVWRQPSADSVTVWEPVPPAGYRAMGACVSASAAAPAVHAVLCVREDATTSAVLFDSPLWRMDPLPLQVRSPALRLPAWACCLAPLCLLFFLPPQVGGH